MTTADSRQFDAAARPHASESAGGGLWLGLLVLLTGVGLLLAPTMMQLHWWWTESYSYTHGYLVVLIGVWFTLELLRHRTTVWLEPSRLGLVATAGVGSALTLAIILSIDSLQHLLLPMLVMSIALAVGGVALLKVMLPPAVMLYFALPIWEPANMPLQWLTTTMVGLPLSLHGFPAEISGFNINVPAGEFTVAGGCSGLHYLLVAAIIGGFLALTDGRDAASRIKILALAVVLALFTNWVRVYTLVLVGQYTDMQHYLIAEDHYFYGWVLFGLAMAVFFWVSRRWTRRTDGDIAALRASKGRRPGLMMGAIGVLLSMLAAAGFAATRAPSDPGVPVLSTDTDIVVYRSTIGDWRPVQAPESLQLEGAAVADGQRLEWFLAVYPAQGPLVDAASGVHLAYGEGWMPLEGVQQRGRYRVAAIQNEDQSAHRLVAWRLRVGGDAVVGKLAAKRAQLLGLAKGRRDADFHAISVDCESDCDARRESFVALADRWFSRTEIAMAPAP